jgi:hypothetical protein
VSDWSGATTYDTGDIFYNDGVDDKLYKTLSDGVLNEAAPNATFYEEITAASLYTDELANTSIDWGMLDDVITCRLEDRIKEEHEKFADKFLASKCSAETYSEGDFLSSLLDSIYSALDNDRAAEAEEIVRGIETYFINQE